MSKLSSPAMSSSLAAFEPPALPSERGRRDELAREADAAVTAAKEAARLAGLAAARHEIDEAIARADDERRELERARQLAASLAASIRAVDETVVADLADHVLTMAVELAEAIVGRELRSVDDALADALRRGLALVPDRGDVVVRVHPDDVDLARDLVAPLATWGRDATVHADHSVERGGCVLDVDALRIDAQVGPALQRLRELLQP